MVPTDPVCNMEIDPDDAAGRSDYEGKTYYFCSTHCKKQFDFDPEACLEGDRQEAEPAAEESVESIDLPVSGMHCASCARTIEKSLKGVEGVEEASVNFAAETARVSYVPSQASRSDLEQAVREAGYDVKQEGGRCTLSLTGMTCQSCANTIGKALSNVEGVEQADVNFATEEARVTYDPRRVSRNDLVKAV